VSGVGVLLTPLRTRDDLGPARRLAENARCLAAHISHGAKFVAAIGGVAALADASHSYSEARRALEMVQLMPDLGAVVAWEDLGVFRAVALLPQDEIATRILD